MPRVNLAELSNREAISTKETVVVVCAGDDGYVMALAATVRSALACFARDRRMHLYVLDGGINAENKRRLLASWIDPRLTVQFVRPDTVRLQGLKVSDHVSIATYLRLLMPFVLPNHVQRAIYLDADLTLMRDLSQLWDLDQAGSPCLAAQDAGAPYFNAATWPAFSRCKNHLADLMPIANFRELGLPEDGKYFNAGVLLVDLEMWRREKLAEKMFQVLRDNQEHIRYFDQYALNVVLAGRWKEIDPRWNQSAYVHAYPSWQHSPFDSKTFQQVRDDPWIVHFCSHAKPWHYFCYHPNTQDFRKFLKKTDWHAWQPPVPSDYLRKWWRFHFTPVRRFLKGYEMQVRELLRPERARKAG